MLAIKKENASNELPRNILWEMVLNTRNVELFLYNWKVGFFVSLSKKISRGLEIFSSSTEVDLL
jgi:hypothetical protein